MIKDFIKTLNNKNVEYDDMTNGFNNQLLVNGDSLKLLPLIPTNSIDHVDIDVPYLLESKRPNKLKKIIARKKATGQPYSREKNALKIADMDSGFPVEKVLPQLLRITKHVNIAIWCSHKQTKAIYTFMWNQHIKNLDWRDIHWDKTNDNHILNGNFNYSDEHCLIFYQKGYHLIHGKLCTKVTDYITPSNKDAKKFGIKHPTVKPLFIVRNIIYSMTKPHDTVLDCYMGSGTSGVASKMCNRNYIGIEIMNKYYKMSIRRMQHSINYDKKMIDYEIKHISSDEYTKQQAIKAARLISNDMKEEAFATFNSAISHSTVKSMHKPTPPNPTPKHTHTSKPAKSTEVNTNSSKSQKHISYSATKDYKYKYNHSTKAKFCRIMLYIKKNDNSKNSKYYHWLEKYSQKELYRYFTKKWNYKNNVA